MERYSLMNKTILLAEDDIRISDIVSRYLAAEHFTLHIANDGEQALQLFEKHTPDMVILDIMLPKLDGTEVCEKIRTTSNVPIIMLTALSGETDLLQGFAKGADDYISKPFNPRELMARVNAIFRRLEPPNKDNNIIYGPLSLNPDERVVICNGSAIDLTQIEFSLLHIFMSNPKKVHSREELLSSSHNTFTDSHIRSIDFHIKNLRRKLDKHHDAHYIKAIYGVGYKFD